jgi:hypothetical protein
MAHESLGAAPAPRNAFERETRFRDVKWTGWDIKWTGWDIKWTGL